MSRSPPVQSKLHRVLVPPGFPSVVSHSLKGCLGTPQGILAQRSESTESVSPHGLADFQEEPMLGPALEGTNLIYT